MSQDVAGGSRIWNLQIGWKLQPSSFIQPFSPLLEESIRNWVGQVGRSCPRRKFIRAKWLSTWLEISRILKFSNWMNISTLIVQRRFSILLEESIRNWAGHVGRSCLRRKLIRRKWLRTLLRIGRMSKFSNWMKIITLMNFKTHGTKAALIEKWDLFTFFIKVD